jgi:anti-sigma regulatory factor (Ser/Thr protein kinase)
LQPENLLDAVVVFRYGNVQVFTGIIKGMGQSNELPPVGDEKVCKCFRAEFCILDDVREFVGQAAETCGLDSDDVYRVQMAVDEAFSNIVEHAYAGEPLEEVECECVISTHKLTIILSDHGKPFDPNKVPRPRIHDPLDDREKGGLGIFFMRKLMDEIEYEMVAEPGKIRPRNVLTMVKRKATAR